MNNKFLAFGLALSASVALLTAVTSGSYHSSIAAPSKDAGKSASATATPDKASGKGEATWQQSQSVDVQLGVRDKFGSGSYEATFEVKDEKGAQSKLKRTAKNDEWCFVCFPSDFGANANPGDYHWKCRVKGKEIAGGKFKIKSNGGFGNELKVEQ